MQQFLTIPFAVLLALAPKPHLQPVTQSASVVHAQPQTKTIYLTLDADMSQGMAAQVGNKTWYDPKLFSYLEDNKIPATFFVSGLFVEKYPDLIKSLNATGNYTFENHGYDESGFTPNCYRLHTLTSDNVKTDQIQKTSKILFDTVGRAPKFFRFPGLCKSAADQILVKNLGYQLNEGDIIVSDPFNFNSQRMIDHTLTQAHEGGTIIMHVGGPNAPKSLEVLQTIVPKLREEGYTIAHLPK